MEYRAYTRSSLTHNAMLGVAENVRLECASALGSAREKKLERNKQAYVM